MNTPPDAVTEAELDVLRQAFEWARTGDVARLAGFLELDGPVNLTNGRGDTLLILAAYHRHADTVDLLLKNGADVERVNDNGQTALGSAVFRQSPEIVTALLEAGADADTGARSARTVAAFFGLPQMQALLGD